jgi:hypothetical protein
MMNDGLTEEETQALRNKLEKLRKRRRRVTELQATVKEQLTQTLQHLDMLHRERQRFLEEFESVLRTRHSLRKFLDTSERWDVINDCFHIWHQGPFATINTCRLGAEAPHIPNALNEEASNKQSNVYTGKHSNSKQTPSPATAQRGWLWSSVTNDTTAMDSEDAPVEAPKVPWSEVNVALGHMVLLLDVISHLSNISLPNTLHPMAAASKITIKGSLYNLYFEESSLWGRHNLRNFHYALNGLCECIFYMSKAQKDKTIAVPHNMLYDSASSSFKIGGIPLVYGYGSSGVDFTRACKYLLTNLKWLVAYSVKHHTIR